MLVSPFIKTQATEEVISILKERGLEKDVRVTVLTNLRPESILNGSTDPEALSGLSDSLARFELVHLPSLHAKVYIADNRAAVITSANLTCNRISKATRPANLPARSRRRCVPRENTRTYSRIP
jgi:phosphatidylserine/phosphatidylglycerophosphate/cardiolipin synthase-like enzyme